MKRATQRQWWLLLTVTALLAAAWWQIRSDRASAPGTLLSLPPDQITHMSLQIGNAPAEHYVKRDEHWWQAGPATPTRADDKRLRELLRIATAPVQSWQPASSYELSKIGLAPPLATLAFDDQTVRFGAMTAIGHNVYVQVGDRVGIVSLRYMPRSAQSASLQAQ